MTLSDHKWQQDLQPYGASRRLFAIAELFVIHNFAHTQPFNGMFIFSGKSKNKIKSLQDF